MPGPLSVIQAQPSNEAFPFFLRTWYVVIARRRRTAPKRMCYNFQKAARERSDGSTMLRLMQPPRPAC